MSKQRAYADLLWVVESPPLLATSSLQFKISEQEKLLLPEKIAQWLNSEEGVAFLEKKIPRRLGRYFEDLFAIILELLFVGAKIIRGIQMMHGKETIGELDFVIESENSIYHIETSVKFYLCQNLRGEMSDFVGANKRDRLDIKYHKIIDQQLINQGDKSVAFSSRQFFVKGRLFYPWSHRDAVIVCHEKIDKNHLCGWWVALKDLPKILNVHHDAVFYITLNRNEWLTNAKFLADSERLKNVASLGEIDLSEPVMIALLSAEKTEIERCFLVLDNWQTSPEDLKC